MRSAIKKTLQKCNQYKQTKKIKLKVRQINILKQLIISNI